MAHVETALIDTSSGCIGTRVKRLTVNPATACFKPKVELSSFLTAYGGLKNPPNVGVARLQSCTPWKWSSTAFPATSILCSEILVAFRVYVIWNKSRKVLYGILAVATVCITVSVVTQILDVYWDPWPLRKILTTAFSTE
ncbi:hypothetical protein CONPUDRAFT_77624 [Coniophora puteana RWD-64-598 SS2]|uniref:Uncharacterized protein n=1 Tax=Coniophora puteana (strain RWD-64-598) TaxID=741705 RepID=A0A5M3M780_CONPW|nr:uncharacterized protein CONPUDRAFT_77624 [Coniophora puteana RWD-64-598 SS2]EIW74786.1 hypothetical protein CONPUDRAFT_77624 [Coniophora puteana RWD-64-598 SS2]